MNKIGGCFGRASRYSPPSMTKSRLPLSRFAAAGILLAGLTLPAYAVTKDEDLARYMAAAGSAQSKGDLVAAAQLLQSAMITSPVATEPYNRLAQLYASAGEESLARKYFAIALNIDPTNAEALKGMALLNLASGDRAGAEAARDLLLKACGKACPETAQVEKALGAPQIKAQ